MITTADRRAADHLRADAYMLEAIAAEFSAKAFDLLGMSESAGFQRDAANSFRKASASHRQDAEQVPHHSEVE